MGRKPEQSSLPAGLGHEEAGVHPASGLRCANFSYVIREQVGLLVNPTTNANITSASDWKTFTTASSADAGYLTTNNRLPAPVTVYFRYRHKTAGTLITGTSRTMRIRITGYDQFGQWTVETTPLLTIVADGTMQYNHFWSSKVFSSVTKIEHMTSGADATNDSMDVGVSMYWDLNPGVSTTNNYINPESVGIGTPLRASPYGQPLPTAEFEMLNLTTLNLDNTNEVCYVQPGDNSPIAGGFQLGLNSSGWQGTPNKFRIVVDTTGGTTPKNTGGTAGTFTVTHKIVYLGLMRASAGTIRGASPNTTYPFG